MTNFKTKLLALAHATDIDRIGKCRNVADLRRSVLRRNAHAIVNDGGVPAQQAQAAWQRDSAPAVMAWEQRPVLRHRLTRASRAMSWPLERPQNKRRTSGRPPLHPMGSPSSKAHRRRRSWSSALRALATGSMTARLANQPQLVDKAPVSPPPSGGADASVGLHKDMPCGGSADRGGDISVHRHTQSSPTVPNPHTKTYITRSWSFSHRHANAHLLDRLGDLLKRPNTPAPMAQHSGFRFPSAAC